jgi:GMP synthase-like glutamine amidotransferase
LKKGMRAHYFQHVPFEGLGRIEPWLVEHGYQLTHTKFFESMALPDPENIDLLIVMGGPMSVHDEDRYPWLAAEKQYVRSAIVSRIPVLGICLGAQIIAHAMGANVYRNPCKEIGWYPIHAVPTDACGAFTFPDSELVFHWHGDTFDLPPGAIRTARSEGCGNQAFQLGSSVIGLQFHLETTPALAKDIVSHCSGELAPSKYVQSADEILSVSPDRYQAINQLMGKILSYLVQSPRE